MIRGSCLCGAVRFELNLEPVWAHHCHCSRCRKAGGRAFASNLFVPLDAIEFTQGEGDLMFFRLPEAERFTHVFCKTCGSSLPWVKPARGYVVVPMGSLDDDPSHTPQAHIFVGSKAPWLSITDSLPQHEFYLDGSSAGTQPKSD